MKTRDRKNVSKLDWKYIAGIDVDAIEKDMQINLEECGSVLQDTLLGQRLLYLQK